MYIFPLPKIFVGFGIFRVEDETEAGRGWGAEREEPAGPP